MGLFTSSDSFATRNFICTYTGKPLDYNELRGNKSIIFDKIIYSYHITKDLIENILAGLHFINDAFYSR